MIFAAKSKLNRMEVLISKVLIDSMQILVMMSICFNKKRAKRL